MCRNLILLISAVTISYSCNSDTNPQKGEARIRGRIVNKTSDFVLLKNREAANERIKTAKLNDKGEFELIFAPDRLTYYDFIYNEAVDDTGKLLLVIDKNFDLKIWVDTKDPFKSLSISGRGTEINKFVATKELLDREFKSSFQQKLDLAPVDFFRFISAYKENVEALLNSLPAGPPAIPEGFREDKSRDLFFEVNACKVKYAAHDLRRSDFEPGEDYFNFMNEVPFNDAEITANPYFMNLASAYAEYLVKKEGNEDSFYNRYQKLGSLFKDDIIRNRALYEFLKTGKGTEVPEKYNRAIEDFMSGTADDSLKKELSISIKTEQTK